MSLRIAVPTHTFPTLSSTPFMNQISGLIERGHRVQIFADTAQAGGEAHPDVKRLGLSQLTKYYERPPPRAVDRWRTASRLIRRHEGAERAVLWRALNPLVYWRRATRLEILSRCVQVFPLRPFDVIYCAFGQDARSALRLRRVGALSGGMVVAFRGSDITSYVARRGSRAYQRVFQQSDLLLPVCDAFARRIIALGAPPERVIVHRTGIDLRHWRFRPRLVRDGEPLRIVTVGRLVEKKGIEHVITAVGMLAGRNIDCTYDIVGDGPQRSRLQDLIDTRRLGGRVRVLGWQSERQTAATLERSHVMAAPSQTAPNGDAEGIPNVLKEAMATGLPVISTRHAGIPELVDDGASGFLVPERDPGAIAERLEWLAGHPERWGEMGQTGRAIVERDYDIERLNDRLVTLFEAVLNGRTRRT